MLENVGVKDGKMMATDLEMHIVAKTDLADGVYEPVGKRFEKRGIGIEEFPNIPIVSEPDKYANVRSIEMDMPYNELKRAIQNVSTDETRAALMQVHFRLEKGSNKVIIEATDGHRASKNTVEMKDTWDGEGKGEFLLNPRAVKLLLSSY